MTNQLSTESKEALRFLLNRIGSWTEARWDQHLRDQYGDEFTNVVANEIMDVIGLP